MPHKTKPGSKARVAEIEANLRAEGKLIIGFCRCPRPRGQNHSSLLRQNMLIDVSDFDNPKHRCITCGSTYSAAGF